MVLVHGTLANMNDSWRAASPVLANHGYCVFALNYGGVSPASDFQGTGDIAASARQLASFVRQVLAATGAPKVDIVGHSQGGMMPRYYISFLGGAAKVAKLIGLAPSNYGTTLDGLAVLGRTLGLGLGDGASTAAIASAAQAPARPRGQRGQSGRRGRRSSGSRPPRSPRSSHSRSPAPATGRNGTGSSRVWAGMVSV